jgi:hypothetical protein
MTVYIKTHNGFPSDEWGVVALLGFRSRGASIKFFEDLEQVPRNRETMLISYIDETRTFFKDMGYEVTEDMSFPVPLRTHYSFWKRKMHFWTAAEMEDKLVSVSLMGGFDPFFCKPANVLKGFQYGVIKTLEEFKAVVDTKMDVVVSEVVDFLAEYRCFVIDKKVVSCQHYLGDLKYYPSISLVEDVIQEFVDAPMGYSIDVGILANGETALIECNDGWSLGSYGCMPKLYTRLLTERWREILVKNPVVLKPHIKIQAR